MLLVHLFSAYAMEISSKVVLCMEVPSFVESCMPHNMGYVTIGAREQQTAIAWWVTENTNMLATLLNAEQLKRSWLEQQDGKWLVNKELLLQIVRVNMQFKKRGLKQVKRFVAAAQEHMLDLLESALMLQPNSWAKMGLDTACMPTVASAATGSA